MINAVIIEDEPLTANRLKKMAEQVYPGLKVIALLQTVKESLTWLANNEQPDLFLMDIRLSDGLSFDIFSEFQISRPVIFTTAYDEYALKAFKANGLDYLLKPIVKEELKSSLDKFDLYHNNTQLPDFKTILSQIAYNQPVYRSRFLIEGNEQLFTIPIEEVAYFGYTSKSTYFITDEKAFHFITNPMEELEKELKPSEFFRINRQYIVSRKSIGRISIYFNNRLKLDLVPAAKEEIIVSRDRVPAFKQWLDH